MSYIAFDLDALNVVASVAAAAGTPPGTIAYGLLQTWAWCFREEVDQVSGDQLAGFFEVDISRLNHLAAALDAFGFIGPIDGELYRVLGELYRVRRDSTDEEFS